MNVYSIYDAAAKAYTTPFFMHNDGLAIRAFQDNINAKDENHISKHPDQYTLFKIGVFDDQTGKIIKSDIIKTLGNGVEYVNEQEQEHSEYVRQQLDAIRKLLEEN